MSELSRTNLRTIPEIKDDLMTHKLRAAQNIVAMGIDLRDAKAQLQHGEWLTFLSETEFAPRTAQNYMRLAEAAEDNPRLASLPYSKALALINAPEEVREQLQAEGVDDKSAAEIRRLTQAIKEEHVARRKAEEENAAAQRRIREEQARADREEKAKTAFINRLDELEKRPPQAVEVTPPDYEDLKTQLIEARQAAAEAEERAEAAMMSAPEPEEQKDTLTLSDALAACTDFQSRCWMLPFMAAEFGGMDERQRNSYRIIIKGVATLCARALETLDGASGIIEGAV